MPKPRQPDPKKPPIPGRKLRHKLSRQQRFERTVRKMPGKNPVFPVLMHSLERYLLAVSDRSDVDNITKEVFDKQPQIPREVLASWVNEWKNVPAGMKNQIVPDYLAKLTPNSKLSIDVLRKPPGGGLHLLPQGATIDDILPQDPDQKPWVYLGQQFTILGKDFSLVNTENAIHIQPIVNDVIQPGDTLIFPSDSSPNRLVATAPTGIGEGEYVVSVTLPMKRTSNYVQVTFQKAPGPAPIISSISPDAQYPGKKVTITGENFGDGLRAWLRSLESGDASYECCADFLEVSPDRKQAIMTVPDQLRNFPGGYMVAVSGNNQGISDWWQTLTVKPFKYRIEFQLMQCIDESDPEWWGSDELVTRWVINRDAEAWFKQSSEYTGFDDNTVKYYSADDKKVFMIDGSAGEVKSQLAVDTQLYEWDEGDAKAWAGPLEKIGEWIGKIPGYEWVKYAATALGYLIAWLGGDPDNLGNNFTTWTPNDLWSKTNNNLKNFTGRMEFRNDDWTGSFSLTYVVFRLED